MSLSKAIEKRRALKKGITKGKICREEYLLSLDDLPTSYSSFWFIGCYGFFFPKKWQVHIKNWLLSIVINYCLYWLWLFALIVAFVLQTSYRFVKWFGPKIPNIIIGLLVGWFVMGAYSNLKHRD